MADPLSITASLIAIVQISGTIISLCYQYSQGINDAPRHVKRILREVRSTRDITERVLNMIDDDRSSGLHYLVSLQKMDTGDGPFVQLKTELDTLEKRLQQPVSQWRKVGKRLTWPLVEKEVNKTLQNVSRMKDAVEAALATDTAVSVMEIRTTTSDLRMALQEAERRSAEQDKQSRFLATLQWLGAVDQSAKHKLLLQKREAGTADWFLQAAEYKSWKTPAGSALWLHGIPGCGKSVIAAVITEDLLNTNAKEERVATAYFHFDFSNKNDSTLGMLLRSVITQLSLQASLVPPCLGRFANDRLKGTKLNGIESTYKDIVAQPDNIDLATLLVEVVDAHFDSVYLVIDAMDEASDLEDLLRYLTDLLSQRSNKLHVLLTSRKETTIVSALENVVDTSVEMDPVATNADIGTYVMNEVARQPKLRKWSEGLRQEVQTALTKDACGMYVSLGAAKILLWLAVSPRPLRLEEAVEVLAIDENEDGEPVFDADSRLQDPTDMARICSTLVTLHKTTVKDSTGSQTEYEVLQLAHQSVKDYLITMPFGAFSIPRVMPRTLDDLCCIITRSLIVYLLNVEKKVTEADLTTLPLLRFAAEYWTHFYRLSEQSADHYIVVHRANLLFFSDFGDPSPYDRCCRIFDPDRPWAPPDLERDDPPSFLYLASVQNLVQLVRLLLSKIRRLSDRVKTGMHGTPLKAAAFHGHHEVFKMLLDAGDWRSSLPEVVDIAAHRGDSKMLDMLDKYDINTDRELLPMEGKSLLKAAMGGHAEVVQRLLRRGDDPNFYNRKGEFHNPLRAAVRNNHKDCVRLILPCTSQKTALHAMSDVLVKGDREMLELFRTKVPDAVLYYAAALGHYDLVTEMLGKGARPQSKHNYGYCSEPPSSALVQAAANGHLQVAEDLIRQGADVNAEDADGYAIMKAAENGHKQIVELLLQHGANTETEGVDGPALQAATFSGYLDIVQMLVANGADLHNPDGRYGGPVQAAVHGDHIDILQYLVEQGADINMGLGNVRRWGPDIQLSAGPLQAAIRTNRAHMINWLLDHGADAYAHEETPLMAAVKYDNTGILNRLVKAGANVNKVSNGYQSTTCLYVAVSGGRTEAVRQLLSMGADPNCSGFHERYFTTTTVLTNACTKDDADIVRALLVAGANVHARSVFNDHDEPPLHSAAKDSKPAVISLLVAHGAKVNEQVHDGWSALHCAAQRENEATLRALISDHKADPKVSLINGSRPIHSAAASGSVGCIKALLEAGVDIDVRNGTGRTPLHWAIERRNVDAVKFLLERGAKKSVKERERGLTAKDMAEMKKREYEWDEKAREIAGLFE